VNENSFPMTQRELYRQGWRSLERKEDGIKSVSAGADPLDGLRVLVVEDEALVAMLIEEYLLELGCKIACSASRIAKAMKGLQTFSVDVAVLDVNVAGENIAGLAETLDRRGIPFVFASGYGARGVDPRWRRHPVLQKPFTGTDLRAALLASLENENGARLSSARQSP
jgi:two-component SAPR family response regulator